MIFVALALLGFGVGDLVRWTPDPVSWRRIVLATMAGVGAVTAVAATAGMATSSVLVAAAAALVVLALWLACDRLPAPLSKSEYPLALVVGTFVVLAGLSSLADPIGGDLATWYANLDFGFVDRVPVEQFVLGAGAFLFVLSTSNRIVRLALSATRASLVAEEGTLRGGRLLGPMERLIVTATVVSGDLAGAGFVIAAKGLLRFREIGGTAKVDETTEYFLIGTFTSVLIAAALGVLILASA
jgi:hypothetical protein